MKSGFCFIFILAFSIAAAAQDRQSPDNQPHITPRNQAPSGNQSQPADEDQPNIPKGESSSRDTQINLERNRPTPPGDSGSDDVQEMYPFDPHKAAKDVEVGNFYLKRKNYRAALERFNEALLYKPKDAEATVGLAQTQEQLGLFTPAYQNYRAYLQILPSGPMAKEAQEAVTRLAPKVEAQKTSPELQAILKEGEAALSQNDFETAYARFAKALQTLPDDPLTNFHLAESLQGMQRLDEARLFYQKSLDLQPNGPHAREARRQISEIKWILGK